MSSPLGELSNLPSLRASQRTPSLKSGAPDTPGITPGGRHFRAPVHEEAALERLAVEATGFIDQLSAQSSRGARKALLAALDLRLVGMRMALRAVPTTADDAAQQEWHVESGVLVRELRQQIWDALVYLQACCDSAAAASDDAQPPSPEAQAEQRARGEAVATPLRRVRSLDAPGSALRTPGSAVRPSAAHHEAPQTPHWGDFVCRTPLPGAPGGLYCGGGGEGDAASDASLLLATPLATPLARGASLSLTPVREAQEDAPSCADADAEEASTPAADVAMQLQLTPLPLAEMADADEAQMLQTPQVGPPATASRFQLSSPAAAAFAASMLSLSLAAATPAPPSPDAAVAADAAAEAAEGVTPDSVLQAGRLFAAASLERGASEAAFLAAEEAVLEALPAPPAAPPQAAPARRGRMHPALRLLRFVTLLAATGAAGALAAHAHTHVQRSTQATTAPAQVVITPDDAPQAEDAAEAAPAAEEAAAPAPDDVAAA